MLHSTLLKFIHHNILSLTEVTRQGRLSKILEAYSRGGRIEMQIIAIGPRDKKEVYLEAVKRLHYFK